MEEKAIRAQIRGFLKKNNLCTSYPVNLNKIAEAVGAFIGFDSFPEKISGAVFKGTRDDYPYLIAVNINKHPHHRRFTIAHELSHIILNHLKKCRYLMDCSDFYNWALMKRSIEREANIGASEMLVPTDELKRILSYNWPINELAKFFGVSRQVMEYRLIEVNGSNSTFVCKSTTPAYRGGSL